MKRLLRGHPRRGHLKLGILRCLLTRHPEPVEGHHAVDVPGCRPAPFNEFMLSPKSTRYSSKNSEFNWVIKTRCISLPIK